MTLRCITVRQPHCGLIAAGLKLVENRSFNPAHRGEIAIHAGAAVDMAELEKQIRAGVVAPFTVLGAVVAVADLTGCHTADQGAGPTCCGVYAQRMWGAKPAQHWTLANVRMLDTPVPARGQLGLWTAPADVERAIRSQLTTTAEER